WEAQGQTDRSRDAFDALLATQPRFTAALFGRGQLELEAQRPAEAEQWFRKALAENPNHRQANYGLYLALQRQGKDDEGRAQEARLKQVEKTLDRLLEVTNRLMPRSPHDPALHHELGTLIAGMGQEDVAVQWYESALREDPNYQPAHRSLSEYYDRTG